MKTHITSHQAYLQFLCKELKYTPSPLAQHITCVDAKTGRPIAGVVFDAYNGATVMAHIWVEDGERPSREWYAAIFDYPFNRLGVYKIVGQVNSANSGARKLDEHLGFVLECKVEGFYEGGDDLLVYTMKREQCRILNSSLWASVYNKVARA